MKINLDFNTYDAGEFKNKCFTWLDENLAGWPLQYSYLGFEHTERREMSFNTNGINTDWWTQCYTRDEYLWWKLSEEFKKAVVSSVLSESTVFYVKDYPDDFTIDREYYYS